MTEPEPISFSRPDISEAEIEAVTRVLRSGWLTTGVECQQLEHELADYLQVPHVVATSSCTAALETVYAYLNLPRGARVGVPTWTFVASALAPARQGATPVLLDVDADTLNLSPESLDAALHAGLDAVVAVHFGGVAVAKDIHDLCARYDVPLIEDAAHALGARDHRGLVAGQGTSGACFSFYATKNLTSGEGGAIATEDEGLAAFARSFRLHGLSQEAWRRYEPGGDALYDLERPGIKGNLPDVLAAIARVQLAKFDEMQAKRRRLITRYRRNLSAIEGLRFAPEHPVSESADHLAVVVLPEGFDRSAAISALAHAGIATSVHFQPLDTFTWFQRNATVVAGGLPTATSLGLRALSLPLTADLDEDAIDRVSAVLEAALTAPRKQP